MGVHWLTEYIIWTLTFCCYYCFVTKHKVDEPKGVSGEICAYTELHHQHTVFQSRVSISKDEHT